MSKYQLVKMHDRVAAWPTPGVFAGGVAACAHQRRADRELMATCPSLLDGIRNADQNADQDSLIIKHVYIERA